MQYLYNTLLLRRLSSNHPQVSKVQDELTRLEAGGYGETRLLRELQDLPDDMIWLANFQCYSPQKSSHQIDFLVLTPHCAIILEVKNMSGTLSYQPLQHEFHRTRSDGMVDIFRNPFDQAYRHQLMLEQYFWLWAVELPVFYAVVMANSNARLDTSFGELPIFHVGYLRRYLRELSEKLPAIDVDILALRNRLEDIAVVLPPRRLVKAEELQCGILCGKCGAVMDYKNGVCTCVACGHKSRTGIQEAMRDYRVLVGDRISNAEFRRFTGIDSIYAASKILERLGYKKVGKNRGVRYILPGISAFD